MPVNFKWTEWVILYHSDLHIFMKGQYNCIHYEKTHSVVHIYLDESLEHDMI